MIFKRKVSIIILIFLSLELMFYLSFKFSKNIIFENRFETENRFYVGRGVLKEKEKPSFKVAVFGGSAAHGYGATISFTEILNNMSILANKNIRFDNHATPATPFYLYQAEKLKRLVNDYDAFIIYAGINEWLHFDHKTKFFPNNTKTTDYKLSKKYWKNLLEEELDIFYNDNHYISGGNLIFNKFTDKIRILNFVYRGFSRVKIFTLRFFYRNFVKPEKENIKEIRYFFQEKFFDKSDYKKIWLENFKNSIYEIDSFLPPEKKIIMSTPISNLTIQPIGDYSDEKDDYNEKQLDQLYEKVFSKNSLNFELFNQVKNGSHKNYLLGMYCLDNSEEFKDKKDCLEYLIRSKNLDEMQLGIMRSIQNFIVEDSPKISNRIELVNIIDFQETIYSNKQKYMDFFVDLNHPSKYGHSYIANKMSKIFFDEEIETRLIYSKETPRCPALEYYLEKKLMKTIYNSKRQCNKISNLIDDWHREFKSFTMKNTHFINDYYIQRNNF